MESEKGKGNKWNAMNDLVVFFWKPLLASCNLKAESKAIQIWLMFILSYLSASASHFSQRSIEREQ